MRYFLIVLFSVVIFCAQAQVIIPDSVARYYLEQNEKVKTYEDIVRTKDQRISNLDAIVKEKNKIIQTYVQDSVSYTDRIQTEVDRRKFVEKLLDGYKKESRAQRRQKNVALGALAGSGAGAAIGSIVPGVGTALGYVGGAAVGGTAGLIVSWIKKK
jgi:hypothetical protein